MAQPTPRERIVAAFLRAWMAEPEKREAALASALFVLDYNGGAMGWTLPPPVPRPRGRRAGCEQREAAMARPRGRAILSVVPRDGPAPRETIAAAFFGAFAVDTGEESDAAFEERLAAAFRAVDAYNLTGSSG